MDNAVVGQSSSGPSNKWWLAPRNLIIAGLIVVLAVAGVIFWQRHNKNNEQAEQVNASLRLAQKAYDKSEYVNAYNIAKGVESQAVGKKQQAQLYQLEAQAASGSGKLSEAAKAYELKHTADPGTVKVDAYTLGTIYDRLGKKDQALAQYRIALEYAKTKSSQYGSDAPAIQASIDALEQKK
ncbi:MAG TPA: hypothetical protein VLI54_02165 [Bacillota bacterium]|nr:hypothetical protein [Bacillota bacterium]